MRFPGPCLPSGISAVFPNSSTSNLEAFGHQGLLCLKSGFIKASDSRFTGFLLQMFVDIWGNAPLNVVW